MVYPIDFIYAEKLQTVIERGSINFRAKDIYDLVQLFDRINNFNKLFNVIKKIFSQRKTVLPASFSNFIKNIDITLLKNSWNSVHVNKKKSKLDFDDIWVNFQKQILKLEKVLESDSI